MKQIFFLFVIAVTFLFAQDSKIIGTIPNEVHFHFTDNTIPTWADFEKKVVLIDFWATWCAPCIKSFPHLNELVDKYKDKPVHFISLTYEPKKLIDRFLEKYELKSEVAFDNDFATFHSLNGWAIPNVLMINQEGIIVGRIHPEYLTEDIIDDILAGKIPDVEQTQEDLFDAEGAEEYFRSTIPTQMKKFGIDE